MELSKSTGVIDDMAKSLIEELRVHALHAARSEELHHPRCIVSRGINGSEE